jgi:hypothetical protein
MSRLDAAVPEHAPEWHRPAAEAETPPARSATRAAMDADAAEPSPSERPVSERSRAARTGGIAFLSALDRIGGMRALERARWVVAQAPRDTPRGKLGVALDDAVETSLASRGALPPGVDVDAAIDDVLRDRMMRVRALERPGLAVLLPSLRALADDRGRLCHDDSATLCAWTEAARQAPIALLVDDGDAEISALVPQTIADLVAPRRPRSGAPSAMDPTPTPPPAATAPRRAEDADSTPAPPTVVTSADQAATDEPDATAPSAGCATRPETEAEAEERGTSAARAAVDVNAAETPVVPPAVAAATMARTAERTRLRIPLQRPQQRVHERMAVHPAATTAADPAALADQPEPHQPIDRAPQQDVANAAQRAGEAVARRVVSAAEWRALAVELDAARGPKPARQIDRLFTTRYLPLVGAAARGEIDGAVRGVIDAWRASFEHSYTEGFPALRVTGKRPAMVLDAPDIAARIGRLNGARSVKLLLVDSMSFDLGERTMQALGQLVTGRALCVERVLLWSALPTNTHTQMNLLARGPDALRDPPPTSEREPEVARGRALSTLRRERVGSRELLKLDLVEARLRSAGAAYDERLDAIAAEVAPVLARAVLGMPPRTLLFVFGDHGFRLPVSPDFCSTGPATQGEASPEEVLVPGYALLTGGVH